MLTQADYINLMKHGLGKSPDSRHSLFETFNRAGRRLVGCHDWSWRVNSDPVLLPAVANQRWIDLPADFGQNVACYIDNETESTGFSCIEPVPLTTIAAMRGQHAVLGEFGPFYVSFPSWGLSPAKDTQPTKRLQVYPTPTVNGEPTLSLLYRCVWREISSGDTTAVPNIPLDFEHALILLCRAFAVNIENQEAAFEDVAFQAEYKRLIEEDGMRQMSLGRLTGGASSRGGFDTIVERRVGEAVL